MGSSVSTHVSVTVRTQISGRRLLPCDTGDPEWLVFRITTFSTSLGDLTAFPGWPAEKNTIRKTSQLTPLLIIFIKCEKFSKLEHLNF